MKGPSPRDIRLHHRLSTSLCAAAVAAVLLVGGACGDQATGPPEIAAGPESPEGSGLGLDIGETRSAPEEDRSALLTILRARVENSDSTPYSAELARTVDAELYRDVDVDTDGPTQRISRASVVDDDGTTLWSDRVLTSFQLLEYLKIILEENASVEFTLNQVYTFIESDYPNLLEFPVQVPVGLEGGSEYVLEVKNNDGEFYEVARLDLQKLEEQAAPPEQDPSVETLEENGPPADRLDITILPDGYTESQREDFRGDARAVVDRFASTSPFAEHMDMINFRTAWIPSEESGAGYDCGRSNDGSCNEKFADTSFRYTFVVSALVDQFDLQLPEAGLRVAFPIDVSKIFEVAATTPFDEVILLSNSERRSGFGGMKVAALTSFDDRTNFPDVAVHEFGHSFGALGDEYFIEADPCRDLGDQAELPANISRFASREKLKWSRWVSEDTPLPTPNSARDRHDVGAYKKAYNCSSLYRPSFQCKMRASSSGPFCAVCREHLTRRLYNDVDLLRRGYPKVEPRPNGNLQLESGVRAGGARTQIQWRLDGEPAGSGRIAWFEASDVPSEWTKLELEVTEDSGNVRKDDPRLREGATWWVRSP